MQKHSELSLWHSLPFPSHAGLHLHCVHQISGWFSDLQISDVETQQKGNLRFPSNAFQTKPKTIFATQILKHKKLSVTLHLINDSCHNSTHTRSLTSQVLVLKTTPRSLHCYNHSRQSRKEDWRWKHLPWPTVPRLSLSCPVDLRSVVMVRGSPLHIPTCFPTFFALLALIGKYTAPRSG